MGIIREPDGVDFVVSSGRWSAEVSAEVAEFLRQVRLETVRSSIMTPCNSDETSAEEAPRLDVEAIVTAKS